MKLEEAIQHCDEVIEKNIKKWEDECNKYQKCIDEHKLLKHWLEELLIYKKYGIEDDRIGEWVIAGINGHLDILECSECGYREFNHYNYCPECGCRMVNGRSRNKCGKVL